MGQYIPLLDVNNVLYLRKGKNRNIKIIMLVLSMSPQTYIAKWQFPRQWDYIAKKIEYK